MEIHRSNYGKSSSRCSQGDFTRKVAAVGDSAITMAVLLVGEDHGAHMYATFDGKRQQELWLWLCIKTIT